MQADAEHQQDDAHLGQLRCNLAVRSKAGGEGTGHDAGTQIADQRRQAQAESQRSQHESKHQTADNGGNQGRMMKHGAALRQSLDAMTDSKKVEVVPLNIEFCIKKHK